MTRTGYLSGTVVDNAAIDAELSMLADIFNGRILIVNSGFKIIKDTFSLSEGKVCISEETIRCFLGEATQKYNTEKHYFLLAIPITENVQTMESGSTPKTAGVMLVTASTESMTELEERLLDRAELFQLTAFLAIAIAAVIVLQASFRPFDAIVGSINRVAEGNLDEDIEEMAFSETKRISGSLNHMLENIKTMEQSRQEFVSNVSHELKTPITSIRVLADSLMGMDHVPEELYKEFMTDISDEIDRESKIIDDLLTLVRMDKESPEMSFQSANVNSLVEMVLKRLRYYYSILSLWGGMCSFKSLIGDVSYVALARILCGTLICNNNSF